MEIERHADHRFWREPLSVARKPSLGADQFFARTIFVSVYLSGFRTTSLTTAAASTNSDWTNGDVVVGFLSTDGRVLVVLGSHILWYLMCSCVCLVSRVDNMGVFQSLSGRSCFSAFLNGTEKDFKNM